MRRVVLIVWFALVIAVGGALGSRPAKAQQGCDTQCFCSCQYNNRGPENWHMCIAPCQWCGGGANGACETDFCGGNNCGDGWVGYCTWLPWCHMFPRCMGQNCA
jgi:hypothetical protein